MQRPCVLGLVLFAACGVAPERRGADSDTMLFFTVRANSSTNDPEVLYVVPVDGDVVARVVWRGDTRVLARPDRDHVLLRTDDLFGVAVVDLANGTHRTIDAGGKFVALHGDEVLYRGDTYSDADDHLLYAAPWAETGPRRRLADTPFAEVLLLAGNRAFAITDACEVWEVDVRTASARAVWAASSPVYDVHDVSVALSPNGRLLAIGDASPNHDGTLTVVDLPTATVVRLWADLPIAVSRVSSFHPTLEVGWCDDETVVCSETRGDPDSWRAQDPVAFVFVRRSLASGAITSATSYGPIGIRHSTPPPPGVQPPAREGVFSTDDTGKTIRVLRAGCTEPVATLSDGFTNGARVYIAPDGQSAFVCGDDSRTVLFTASHTGGRPLCEHWADDPVWLRIGDTTNRWPAAPRCRVVPTEPRGTH